MGIEPTTSRVSSGRDNPYTNRAISGPGSSYLNANRDHDDPEGNTASASVQWLPLWTIGMFGSECAWCALGTMLNSLVWTTNRESYCRLHFSLLMHAGLYCADFSFMPRCQLVFFIYQAVEPYVVEPCVVAPCTIAPYFGQHRAWSVVHICENTLLNNLA